MSQFRDLIARMAIDAEFARHTRANPDTVARQYSLTAEETLQLRGLADAAAGAGPTALGARLSKSGGNFGGVVTTLAADLDLTHDLTLDPDTTPADPPQTDPPPPPSEDDKPVNFGIDFSQLKPALDLDPIVEDSLNEDSAEDGDEATRTYEALGDKIPEAERTPDDDGEDGSGGEDDRPILDLTLEIPGTGSENEPAADAGESGSDTGGDGDSPGFGIFGDHTPFGDPDDDGLPNMFDQQPHNPDTSDEPFADNDGDGQPNRSDPQPDNPDTSDEPADDGGSDTDGDGGSPGFGIFGAHSPFGDSDGDGIPNMFDQQPHNPDTSDEPFADNDGDGQPNRSDPTPDGLHVIRPDIDLSGLGDLNPGPEINLPPDLHVPGVDGTGPTDGTPEGETPGDEPPTSETPGDEPPTSETPGDEPPADETADTGETATEAATEAATETGNPSTHDEAGEPADTQPDTPQAPDSASTSAETGEVLAQDAATGAAGSTQPDDDGLGLRDYAIGGAGLAAGAVAGGVAGAATSKAKGGQAAPETPTQS